MEEHCTFKKLMLTNFSSQAWMHYKRKILQKQRKTIQFTYKDSTTQVAILSLISSKQNIEKMRIKGAPYLNSHPRHPSSEDKIICVFSIICIILL